MPTPNKHKAKIRDLTTDMNLWKQRCSELEGELVKLKGELAKISATPKREPATREQHLIESAREACWINGR